MQYNKNKVTHYEDRIVCGCSSVDNKSHAWFNQVRSHTLTHTGGAEECARVMEIQNYSKIQLLNG